VEGGGDFSESFRKFRKALSPPATYPRGFLAFLYTWRNWGTWRKVESAEIGVRREVAVVY
jgi:hypothetical protein